MPFAIRTCCTDKQKRENFKRENTCKDRCRIVVGSLLGRVRVRRACVIGHVLMYIENEG